MLFFVLSFSGNLELYSPLIPKTALVERLTTRSKVASSSTTPNPCISFVVPMSLLEVAIRAAVAMAMAAAAVPAIIGAPSLHRVNAFFEKFDVGNFE